MTLFGRSALEINLASLYGLDPLSVQGRTAERIACFLEERGCQAAARAVREQDWDEFPSEAS